MAQALSTIDVFAPYSTLGVGGSLVSLATFNVTDMSERSATLMADDYVKLVFNDTRKFTLPAFSFIWYDSQLFFLREVYRPVPKGNYYSYDMKFVSISNLLNKPICFRRVVVGTSEWDEPEITMNGTLADMMQIVLDSIKVAADRYLVDNSGTAVLSLFGSLLKGITYEAELENTDLLTFTYSGAKISEVLSDISSKYETEWWIQEIGGLESGITLKLHMSKCERTDTDILEVSDTMAATGNPLHPTKSRGLLACEYSQEWTGVPQRVIGFGSDRNMEKQQAIQNEMLVSFGKKLRLDYEHSYTDSDGVLHEHQYEVTDADGNKIPLDVSPDGSVCVAGISTGEEIVKEYDEIYPRCYFRVVGVKKRGIENQIYTVFGLPLKAGDIEMTAAEIESAGLFPLNIAAGETLSVKFETGYLCGREFEVANKSAKYSLVNGTYEKDVNGHWLAVLEIVPDGDIEDGSQIPYGNFAPRPKESGGYEGDKFAIFNMIMPDSYVTFAQEELAQRVYEEITEASSTRPEVKCTGDPEYFQSQSMYLGRRVAVTSELFDDNIIPEVLDHRNLISSLCLSSLIGCTYDKDSTSCFIADNDNVAIGSFEVRLYKGITLVSTPFIKTKMGKHSLTIVKDSSFDSIGFFVSGAKDEGGAIFTPAMTDGVSYTISFNGYSLTANGGGRFINIKVEEGVEAHIWTIAPEDTTCRFVSRVTYFTHSLTKPHVIEFKLASSQVLGSISALQAAIADKTNEITNIEQMARTLSRRGFYDAMEMKEMLETLAAEMMVVGVEKNQFAFTMGISVVNGRIVGSVNHFDHMEVTAGYIQHTQEPYIDDAGNGLYQVAAKNNIYTDINSSFINDTPDEAYYVAALLDRALGTAEIVLIGKTLEESLPDGSKYMQNENYLLLGILSSEFEDGATSYRVFNRSNGYTQITGGTLTTEQIQDPTRSLIIDFASDPPRIIARNGAKIIGGIEFELTEEQIEDILGRVDIGEIGGENLFRAEDWADWGYRATSFEHILRSDDLDAGKYVMTGKVYSTYSGCKVLAQYSDGTTEEMLNEAFPSHLSPSATEDNLITTGAGITLDLSFEMTKSGYVTIIPTSQNTNDYYRIALVEVMLQKGDRATAFQPYVEHLAQAFRGSTDVVGGLLATSVILLRDGSVVTAGISGIKDDNILLFGGGTYADAVEAASNEDYTKIDGTPIMTLFKKDGTGKTGVFFIEQDKVKVKTNDGTVVIDDTDGISCRIESQDNAAVIVTPQELKTLDALKALGQTVTKSQSYPNPFAQPLYEEYYGAPDGYVFSETKSYKVFVGQGGTLRVYGDAVYASHSSSHGNGVIVGDQDLDGIVCRIKNSSGSVVASGKVSDTNQTSLTYNVPIAGEYTIEVYSAIYISTTGVVIEQDERVTVNVYLDQDRTYVGYTAEYNVADKQTMVAHKGIFSYQGETAYFYYKDGVGLDCRIGNVVFKISSRGIIMSGLDSQSSVATKDIGTLYADTSGNLKIKTS